MTSELKTDKVQLEEAFYQIKEIATDFGLDPYDTHFQLAPPEIIYEFGAYGIPGRFSHWTHGKAYHQMKMMYDYGLSKIYELVINNDPAQAFLLENNALLQNKLVIAHVLGHTDFFKNNVAFAQTNRKMIESAHLNADRIKQYEYQHGYEEIEKFLDKVISLEQNISVWGRDTGNDVSTEKLRRKAVNKSEYDDLLLLGQKSDEVDFEEVPFPEHEEQDLLGFLLKHSPNRRLQDWQKDIMSIVNEEMRYFAPQMKTKIMNEGWASFWHNRIFREMGERGYLNFSDEVEWTKMNADVLHPDSNNINPYYVGYNIWQDIQRRFQGDLPKDHPKSRDWLGRDIDVRQYIGREDYDIFWVRKNVGGDNAFILNYLSDQMVEELDLYNYEKRGDQWVVTEKSPDQVRANLFRNLSNFGMPDIVVEVGGGDYKGNSELYLKHNWDGQNLDEKWSKEVLKNIRYIWGRPVHLETKIDDKGVLYTCSDPNTVGSSTLS